MLNVIISGAPGCGKGTQSALIIEKYKLKHFSTGELLRNEIEEKTPLGLEAEKFISKGNLVPDEMIIDVLTHAIKNLQKDCKGIILDGYPRTVKQAEELERLMDKLHMPTSVLINLEVPNRELINRLLTRGKTSGRSDDNLETIKKRLDVFESKTAPINAYYQSLHKFVAVDGMGEIQDIFTRISHVLDKIKGQKQLC
jgi:adenylate kinase